MFLIYLARKLLRLLYKLERFIGRLYLRLLKKISYWENIDYEWKHGDRWYLIHDEPVPPWRIRKQKWKELYEESITSR